MTDSQVTAGAVYIDLHRRIGTGCLGAIFNGDGHGVFGVIEEVGVGGNLAAGSTGSCINCVGVTIYGQSRSAVRNSEYGATRSCGGKAGPSMSVSGGAAGAAGGAIGAWEYGIQTGTAGPAERWSGVEAGYDSLRQFGGGGVGSGGDRGE